MLWYFSHIKPVLYTCVIHLSRVMEDTVSKRGYIARKREARALEQTHDDYGAWLVSSGMTKQTCAALIRALRKQMVQSHNKHVSKVMIDMQSLLSTNPIFAQDLALSYQQEMKQHYEKLFRSGATHQNKKKKLGT